jgi:hypothetical protein
MIEGSGIERADEAARRFAQERQHSMKGEGNIGDQINTRTGQGVVISEDIALSCMWPTTRVKSVVRTELIYSPAGGPSTVLEVIHDG